MIVADANLIAYLLLNGPFTSDATAVLQRDQAWIAPGEWRMEFLNVLAKAVRMEHLSFVDAREAWAGAPTYVTTFIDEISPMELLAMSVESGVAVYDCCYIATARKLNTHVVTADKQMIRKFPEDAISIEDFARGK